MLETCATIAYEIKEKSKRAWRSEVWKVERTSSADFFFGAGK
jgi:hypothetical protein